MAIRMAYEVVMSYHLHMPSYFLGTFTEYPYKTEKVVKFVLYHLFPLYACHVSFLNLFPEGFRPYFIAFFFQV